MGDEGGMALARALSDRSRGLTRLDVSSNHLGLPGISSFANMLQARPPAAGAGGDGAHWGWVGWVWTNG